MNTELLPKEIILKNGRVVLVDEDDYDFIMQWMWKLHIGGYACRSAGSLKQGYRCILMHRVIAKTPPHMETDHINGDKLDNRKSNLRNVDRSTNEYNKKPTANNTSGYRGICWDKNKQAWLVRASHKHLGRFRNLQDAIRCRADYLEKKEILTPDFESKHSDFPAF